MFPYSNLSSCLPEKFSTGSPDLFRTMAIVRSIPVSIIRDPLCFSFFVSAPAGALSSFVCALHRFSDKCLDCRMAWPSSRPRDSSPRIICGEPSSLKATMPKSFDFGLFEVVPAKRETLLGYAQSAPVCARVSRVRAGVLCVSSLEQGFSLRRSARAPRFSGIFAAFCDDNASICVYFAPGTGGPLESCAAFLMFVALFHHY